MTRTRAPYKRRVSPATSGASKPEPGRGASDPGNQSDMTGYATLGRAIGMMAKGMGG